MPGRARQEVFLETLGSQTLMLRNWILVMGLVIGVCPAVVADDELGSPVTVGLRLNPTAVDMERLRASRMGYMPTPVNLGPKRLASVVKEPAYAGSTTMSTCTPA